MNLGPLIALISLLLLAGAVVLILFTLLGGAVDHNPTNRFYFLEADTSGIAGAASLTRWTFWNACSVSNGRNDCPKAHAAYPFDPKRNFDGPDDGIPDLLLRYVENCSEMIRAFADSDRHSKRYYFLTRFMFAFALIALFFTVMSLFLGLLALFSRIASVFSSAMSSVALFFQALTTALMT